MEIISFITEWFPKLFSWIYNKFKPALIIESFNVVHLGSKKGTDFSVTGDCIVRNNREVSLIIEETKISLDKVDYELKWLLNNELKILEPTVVKEFKFKTKNMNWPNNNPAILTLTIKSKNHGEFMSQTIFNFS